MVRKLITVTLILIIGLVVAAAAGIYWFLSGDGIRRTLEQQASAWLGQPVQIGSARAQLLPRIGIQLGDVRAGNPVRLQLRNVAISASLRPLLSRRIEDAVVTISGSRLELPLAFSIPSAKEPPADARSADQKGGGVELVSVRAITLRDVVIASRGREVTVSADSSLTGTNLEIERFTASSGRTALDASGMVALEPRVDAQLMVKASTLDVDELLALANAFSPSSATRAARQPATGRRAGAAATPDARIRAHITADRARVGELEARRLAADLQAEGERVTLSPLTLELFGGKYEGSVAARLGRTMSATIASRLTNIDVAELAAFGGAAGSITGRLSATGTFSGEGADMQAALAEARGSGTARIVDGVVRHLDLVRTIVLFFGRPAPDGRAATDRFESIDVRFALANQVFRADAFEFHSADVDIAGTGTLTIPNKSLDGTLSLSLSEELSKQAGTDLVRFTREGNRVLLPGRLSGTIDSPRVTIDAKAAISRGIRNEAERRLKGVLDDLFK